MEFFNIGGGELIIIVLLALILFRPADIYKAMRTLGRYTRSARRMWNEFSANIKQEMETQEIAEALAEAKDLRSSAEDAVATLKTTVTDVKKTVEGDVSAAGKSLKAQAAEGVTTLKTQTTLAVSASAAPADVVGPEQDAVVETVCDEPESTNAGTALPDVQAVAEVYEESPDEVSAQ